MCVLTLKISHRPNGKIADVLALTHACTTANSSVNYRRYVPQRPSKVPIAPMGIPADLPNQLSSFNSDRYLVLSGICTCQPCLQTSHRPDGIFTRFALVLAGRRCLCREWHGDLLIVHHHWQHSLLCVCSHSKFPIALMGFSHV